MNWEDIKIFLEVARSARLSIASRRLAMDSSTVSRRLHKLEQSLQVKLFERTVDGHELTIEGKRLLKSARKMEFDASNVLNDLKYGQNHNAGVVRIGVTEAFGNFFIAPNLTQLQASNPDIQIDLLQFSRFVKISRNEADVAITVEKPNVTSMIVNKLCDYQLKLYAHSSYLQNAEKVTLNNLNTHPWVSYVENLLFTEQLSYLEELPCKISAKFRATSVVSQYTAIKSGFGIGILPCFLAAQDPQLVNILSDEIQITRSFYLVAHPESKRLARVETVWRYLKNLCRQHQTLLMGD